VIREDFDPVAIASAMVARWASCLSVLTDKTFFQEGLRCLVAVRQVVELPLLCKGLHPLPLSSCIRHGLPALGCAGPFADRRDPQRPGYLTYLCSGAARSLDLGPCPEVEGVHDEAGHSDGCWA